MLEKSSLRTEPWALEAYASRNAKVCIPFGSWSFIKHFCGYARFSCLIVLFNPRFWDCIIPYVNHNSVDIVET